MLDRPQVAVAPGSARCATSRHRGGAPGGRRRRQLEVRLSASPKPFPWPDSGTCPRAPRAQSLSGVRAFGCDRARRAHGTVTGRTLPEGPGAPALTPRKLEHGERVRRTSRATMTRGFRIAVGRHAGRLRSRRRRGPRRDDRRPAVPRRPERRVAAHDAAGVQDRERANGPGHPRDARAPARAPPGAARPLRPRRRLRGDRGAGSTRSSTRSARASTAASTRPRVGRPAAPGDRRRARRRSAASSSTSCRPTSPARCRSCSSTTGWTTRPASGSRS